MRLFNIEEELKKLPASPGVYIMHGSDEEVIYVGKAVSLRNRVRQYFRAGTKKTPKIQRMISNISYFEYIITDSELEALILECNLIKEHRPKYNTMLKDDKTYPYIKITMHEDYPRIFITRSISRSGKDRSRYFGPYANGGAVKDTVELLQKIYKIRSCGKSLPKDAGKSRVCLNYHIKQCSGPCMDLISREEYGKSVEEVIDFLSGNFKPVINLLECRMNKASGELRFEEAAEYRDMLSGVKHIAQKQKAAGDDMADRDIVACESDENDAVVQVFSVRGGKLIGREHFYMKADTDDTKSGIISEFVKQYYGGTPMLPKEILIQCDIKDRELISEWLSKRRGSRVRIIVPQKGDKEKMMAFAARNAKIVLEKDREKIKREEMRTAGAAEKLAKLLDLPHIKRVEAYDISNTAGYRPVGSMVVYENGKPKKSDYRKFKINTVTGSDDYKSLAEVLTRRFTDGRFNILPDLIMMDGGRGQVNVALKVMESLKINIPVCGMVKDEHHRTRGIYFENREIYMNVSSEEFRLVTRIQDEAHRFAIEYHRNLRGKAGIHSILDDIPGIGAARRRSLMKNFATLEDIKNATIEELSRIDGMNASAAASVKNFFGIRGENPLT